MKIVNSFGINFLGTELRDHVIALNSSNHHVVAQIFRKYSQPLLENAHQYKYVGHMLKLVRADLLNSETLAGVKKRSFIKGKKNVSRRRCLRNIAKCAP